MYKNELEKLGEIGEGDNYKSELFDNFNQTIDGEMHLGEARRFEFKLSEKAIGLGIKVEDLIEDTIIPCSCTSKVSWGDDSVIIILEHADRDPEGLKSTYVKFVLNDGRTKVKNARGGMKWPEDKSTIKLYMNATFVK